jgi:ADP-heptose:LPS heptosyltransferase
MLRGGTGPDGFFLHVVLFQGEDRQPVDHHPGCFRIPGNAAGRRLQHGDNRLIHFLDEIIPLLIETIDGSFGTVHGLEAEIVPPGHILFMPECKVPQMVLLDQPLEAFAARSGVGLVPLGGQRTLEGGESGRGETHGRHEREIELNESRADTSLRIPCMKSLLVIKPSSLGDIVHGLQVIQVLAKARPDVRISWVVRERFAGLVNAAPFVAETIIFRRRGGSRAFFRLLAQLNARRFDAVWDMQGLLRSGLMTAAVRAPEKWGRADARECSGFFCNRRIKFPSTTGPHHALEILLPFVATEGVAPVLDFPLTLKPDAVFEWQPFFEGQNSQDVFVIFTDSRGAAKQWPHFPALMQRILESNPRSRIAWCAGKKSAPPFSPPAGRFLNLTGCSLEEMIALVRKPSVFIGNDSGPMHLSAASGNRVLALFGPTSARRFGPFPLEAPRHRTVTAPGGRLDQLSPEQVLAALNELTQVS